MKVLIYLFIISFLQSYSFDNTLKNENLLKSSSFESRNNPFIALALSAVLQGQVRYIIKIIKEVLPI